MVGSGELGSFCIIGYGEGGETQDWVRFAFLIVGRGGRVGKLGSFRIFGSLA